nr:hypothetical protein [Tanacetum cinerariifolium]
RAGSSHHVAGAVQDRTGRRHPRRARTVAGAADRDPAATVAQRSHAARSGVRQTADARQRERFLGAAATAIRSLAARAMGRDPD